MSVFTKEVHGCLISTKMLTTTNKQLDNDIRQYQNEYGRQDVHEYVTCTAGCCIHSGCDGYSTCHVQGH